jgi:hypothetical protein
MADDITFYDEIESYCSQLSTAPGGSIGLHVSTKAAMFDVVVERWGGAREQRMRLGRLAVDCYWPVVAVGLLSRDGHCR